MIVGESQNGVPDVHFVWEATANTKLLALIACRTLLLIRFSLSLSLSLSLSVCVCVCFRVDQLLMGLSWPFLGCYRVLLGTPPVRLVGVLLDPVVVVVVVVVEFRSLFEFQ